MLTFTQSYTEVADNCGFSATTSSQSLTNAKRHINLANRNFMNGSRRYWTNKRVTTNLVQGQTAYTFPEDMVRITTVKIQNGALTLPITLVDSEELWNRITIIPAMTVGYPTQGFIRGRNQLELYPVPSVNVTNGLIVSYESRMRDMTLDDTTNVVVTVTNNSNVLLATTGSFTAQMVGMWVNITDNAGDGNWYQIVGYTDATHITLENYYQGPTVTGASCIIAFVSPLPEDFHQAPIDYASYRYFLKRGDKETAADYKSLYTEAMQNYIARYASKTTGVVQRPLDDIQYNLFNLPPTGFSI